MSMRVVLERGPKAKKFAAFAVDWPGWSRGAKTAEAAIETLAAYRERYRPIAVRAGLERTFDECGPLEVVEDRVGPGSTDFWGISFARGGGRDRDTIIRHTIRVESEQFARKVGVVVPEQGALGPALAPYRTRFLAAMRAYQRGEITRPMRSWTLPYLVRHSAFHTMDHAWEMEDKDLSG